MSNWTIPFTVRLDQDAPFKAQTGQGLMLPGDHQAHTIEVTVLDREAPATLTGTPKGFFTRADGRTVVCGGTRSGNVVRVTMERECYMTGPLRCVIRLLTDVENNLGLSLVDADFYVREGIGEEIVDPDGAFPTVQAQAERLEEVENQVGALDARLDDIENAPALTSALTLASGWSDHPDYPQPVRVVRRGYIVFLEGVVTNASAVTLDVEHTVTLATLPSWARPARAAHCLNQGTSQAVFKITAEPSGALVLSRYRMGAEWATVAANSYLCLTSCWLSSDATGSGAETVDDLEALIARMEAVATGAVRYNAGQSLTTAQQAQARSNIGVTSAIGASAVRYDAAQSLTTAQKTQARTNIDAASIADIEATAEAVESVQNALDATYNAFFPEIFNTMDIDPYNILVGFKLSGTGLTTEDPNFDIERYYPLTAGSVLHIKVADDAPYTYQFQDGLTFGMTHLIGDVISGAVDNYVVVPNGATCLAVCILPSRTTNKVQAVSGSKTDAVEAELAELRQETEHFQSGIITDIYDTTDVQKYNTHSGYKLKGNGQAEEAANYDIDRYYPLTAGTKLQIVAAGDSDYTYQFQDGLTFGMTHLVGNVVSGAVNDIVTVPSGATCLAICRAITTTTNAVSIIGEPKVDILETELETDIGAMQSEIAEYDEAIYDVPVNLYDGHSVREGGYYNNSGEWTENNAFQEAILPVGAVNSGDTLTYSEDFSYNNDTAYLFDVFREDGTWVKHYALTSYGPVTIVVDAADRPFYVGMRIRMNQNESNLVIVKNGSLGKEPKIDKLQAITNPLHGKTINGLGDSFTFPPNSWGKQLCTRVGATFNNYGQSNSRITIDTSTTQSFLHRYTSMDTTADIVVIFGGINDAASIKTHDIELGTINDEYDSSSPTFYGALKALITGIKTLMPGKKIFGVIPPDFAPNDNYTNTLPLVQQACREVYSLYQIPYADLKKDCQEMWEEPSADGYNNTHYRLVPYDNNWHPSDLGHTAMSEIIQGMLDTFVKV